MERRSEGGGGGEVEEEKGSIVRASVCLSVSESVSKLTTCLIWLFVTDLLFFVPRCLRQQT